MATTLDEVSHFLEQRDLKFSVQDDNTIVTGFGGLAAYRDDDGDAHLRVVIQVQEDGRYLQIFAPEAYRVPAESAGPFLQACAMIQWRTKLIQFEYDAQDGEVRPVVEFPLMDALLTSSQLMRAVNGLVELVDTYHPVLERAAREGVVQFDSDDGEAEMLSSLLSGYSPETLAEALRLADARRRG